MNTCKSEKGKNTSFTHCLLNKASLSRGRRKVTQVRSASGLKNRGRVTRKLLYAHYHLLVGQNGGLARLILVNAFGLCTVFSCVHFLIWGLPVVSVERKSR